MNYIQLWIGKSIDEKKKSYLTNFVKSINFTKDTYTLISEYKILTNKNVKYLDYQTYIDEMLKDELIKQVWEFVNDKTLKSDIIRFHYLSNNPNTIYADIDVIKLRNPKLEDQIYFYPSSTNAIDHCIMYNGTKTDQIKELLYKIIKRVYNPRLKKFYLDKMWVFAYINKYLQGSKTFSEFKHIGMGGR